MRMSEFSLPVFSGSDRMKAEYVAKIFSEAGRETSTARAMHYFALGRKDYPVFRKGAGTSGKISHLRDYAEKDAVEDAKHLTKWIAIAKRIGLIPWDALPDESVEEFGDYYPGEDQDFSYTYSLGQLDYWQLKDVRDYLQRTAFQFKRNSVLRVQPYRFELIIEKGTMGSIIRPICEEFHSQYVAFRGSASWGAAWKITKRAKEDPRPTLIFYLSDLDPSGFLMHEKMASKIAEINLKEYDGELDIRLRRIGLTPEQVVEYHIPVVKRTDKVTLGPEEQARYNACMAMIGVKSDNRAELDALERYYPGGVAALVRNSFERYTDASLGDKCREATAKGLEHVIQSIPLPEEITTKRIELALNPAIRLEELSVFIYQKKKGDKSYRYWKAEWRSRDGKMKQAHLGPAEGKRGLSEEETLQKARRAKAENLGLRISLK